MPLYRVELHSHCQGDPVDSYLGHTLFQHIDRAKEVGLDAIAVTSAAYDRFAAPGVGPDRISLIHLPDRFIRKLGDRKRGRYPAIPGRMKTGSQHASCRAGLPDFS